MDVTKYKQKYNDYKNGKYEVEYIPAKKGIELSEAVCWYLISLVPQGRLTRLEDIEKFLAGIYDVHHVSFDRGLNLNFNPEYWYNAGTKIPRHRVVSMRGYTESIYVEKVIEEGFEIEPAKRNGLRPKVKNYKDYLFDFCNDIEIAFDVIQKINEEHTFEFLL